MNHKWEFTGYGHRPSVRIYRCSSCGCGPLEVSEYDYPNMKVGIRKVAKTSGIDPNCKMELVKNIDKV